MLDFSDIKTGVVVSFNGQPCIITSCQFLRKQQRKPVKICKLKNLITGVSLEYSFKSGEAVEEADLKKEPATFMYASGDTLSFMLVNNYETLEVSKEILSGKEDYLKEGLEVLIVYFNDKPISVELPIKVSYKVIATSEVTKGNSVADIMKDATIETGKIVKVPAFIKVGENIVLNTVEDEYVGRDTEK